MKGFFAYTICLAMLILITYFLVTTEISQRNLHNTKNELLIIEQSNMQRTLLENNVDKIIYQKLLGEITKNNFRVTSVQNEINTALAKYLQGKTKSMTIFLEVTGEVSKDFLNQNSAVTLLQTNGLTYAEYSFTSNQLKTSTVGALIGNTLKTVFLIPPGSTTTIWR
jgi:hypothetical protein